MNGKGSIKAGSSKKHNWLIIVALVTMCFGIAVPLAWHYRFHLLWLVQERQFKSKQLVPVRCVQLPEVAVPDEWVKCRVGCMEFNLPSVFATNIVYRHNTKEDVQFRFGEKVVAIVEPMKTDDPLLSISSKIFDTPDNLTFPHLEVLCYKMDYNRFIWSMTSSQVRQYMYLIALRRILYRSNEANCWMEYSLGGDIDMTVFFEKCHVTLRWECQRVGMDGYAHFFDLEDTIDWDWVRAICRSMVVVTVPIEQ